MADCRICADFDWCLENEDCGLFKPKPLTNADRIRAMTDEEMLSFFCAVEENVGCPPDINVTGKCEELHGENCKSCWLEWLTQEVQDAAD